MIERRRDEDELAAGSQRSSSDEAELDLARFAARVGNELNNPLAGILAAHTFIRRRIEQTAELEKDWRLVEFMDLVETEVQNASRVVDDLVDFGARRPSTLSNFLLRPMVDEIIALTRHAPQTVLENQCGSVVAYLDRDKLRRALARVVQNAAEAISPREAGLVTISAKVEGRLLKIEVKDDGPGISEEVAAQMLKPFYGTKVKGNGLGLTVARELAEQQNGTLTFAPRSPRGASFVFAFPAA